METSTVSLQLPQKEIKTPSERNAIQKNDDSIQDTISQYGFLTAELAAYVTAVPIGTVRNRLTKLVKRKRVKVQRERQDGPHYYRPVGTREVGQLRHKVSIAECRAGFTVGLRKRNGVSGWGRDREFIDDVALQDLMTPVGRCTPDWVFVIHDEGDDFYFTLEVDKGSMRKLNEYEGKYLCNWHWRKKFCYETDGVNKWGIPQLRSLTIADNETDMERLRKQAMTVHPEYAKKGTISEMFLFTTRERWNLAEPEKLFENIWVAPKSDRLIRLLE